MIASCIHDAEQGLLAAMMTDPASVAKVEAAVVPSDFADQALGDLFGLLVDMHHSGESIRDTAMVIRRMRQAGIVERLGGVASVARLADAKRAANAEVYASEVRSASVKRSTLELADQLRAQAETQTPAELVAWLRSELDAIESRATSDEQTSTIGEACQSLIREIRHTQKTGDVPGVASGIDHIDMRYGGFHRARLYVIAARPGVGKSSLSQQVGEAIASSCGAALFVSLEMSRQEIAARYLSRRTGINGKVINSHNVTGAALCDLDAAADESASIPFLVSEPKARNSTLSAITASIRRHQATHGITIAIVDYLQILEPSHPRETEYERFTAASRAFKQLARELQIPVILLSQLNRGSEKDKPREPRLSDLRGTGAIEQDADGVILLHDQGDGTTKLIVPKMRGGERSTAVMRFDGPTCTFSDATVEDHPNYCDDFAEWS
jgi:replicative DNA helicase